MDPQSGLATVILPSWNAAEPCCDRRMARAAEENQTNRAPGHLGLPPGFARRGQSSTGLIRPRQPGRDSKRKHHPRNRVWTGCVMIHCAGACLRAWLASESEGTEGASDRSLSPCLPERLRARSRASRPVTRQESRGCRSRPRILPRGRIGETEACHPLRFVGQ